MSHRIERLRSLILEVGSEILRRVKEPAIVQALEKGTLISIADVELSRDLGHARLYVSILGSAKKHKEIMESLQRATGYFRHELRAEMNIKVVPEVAFVLDDTQEKAAHMMAAISAANEISKKTEASNALYEQELLAKSQLESQADEEE